MGRWRIGAARSAVLSLLALFCLCSGAHAENLQTVRLQLKWRHQFQFAGYYAAVEKGYFRQAGLKVELLAGGPGIDPLQPLVAGQADYAVLSPSVLLDRQRGMPVVVLAAIFQHSANVLMTRRDTGLFTPHDLEGKRIMLSTEPDPEIGAMLKNEGVSPDKLHIVPPNWSVEDLAAGRIDGQSAYLSNEPYLLKQRGVEPFLIRPETYGIDFYGDCLVTTEGEISAHPKRVEGMRRAVQQGWQYALEHQEEIARLIASSYSQEKSLDHLLFEAKAIEPLIRSDLVEIGYINPQRWQRIGEIYAQMGMITGALNLNGFLYPMLEEERDVRLHAWVRQALGGLVVVLVLGITAGVVLLVFNNRLAGEVERRTSDLSASERSFRAFFELASVGVAQVDVRSGRFVRINRKFCTLLGDTEEKLQTAQLEECTHPDDVELDRRHLAELIAGRIAEFTVEIRLLSTEEVPIWVILSASPLWSAGEEPDFALVVVRDITKRKLAEEELVFASKVFEHSIEGIVVTDAGGTILQVNPAFTAITGYSAREAIGNNPRILKSNRHGEEFYRRMWIQLGEEGQWAGEIWNRRKDGEVYPEWLTINAVRNPQGKITNYVSIFHDITELKRQQEALEHQAQHDALTGIPNRVLLNDRLQVALNRMGRTGRRVALLFFDLDHFKNINDGFGHMVGDTLLVQLAERLKSQLRIGDTLARQGGDEFLILLPEVEEVEDVSLVAARLLETLQRPFVIGEIECFVTASVGVTIAPDDGREAGVLIKNADMAMYRAKKLGRNNFQFFTTELDVQAHRRIHLESKLRKAIELAEFELMYQPLVDCTSGVILGAEALVRWRQGAELISPAEFIPLAEESGLIEPLGEWVLRTAAAQARQWQDAGHAINMSVNLSSRQFTGRTLVDLLAEVNATIGPAPGRLYFEITESLLMEDIVRARGILEELREGGGRFYLDDFGTGYSSLSYLKRLPMDGLKIDRVFIRDLAVDSGSRAIASAIVSLAQTLNLAVVAEGVETREQLAILHAMSDRLIIQGFLASRPLPAEEFETLLTERRRLLPEREA